MKSSLLMKNLIFVPFILTAAWKLFSKSKAERFYGPLKTPKKVNIQRYMGPWYIIASISTLLEHEVHNAVENYTWNVDDQRIDIDFTYNKNHFDGELVHIKQRAFIHNPKTNAEWRTQLYHKFPYVIMDLAHDYSYAIVGTPNREQVWILCRESSMDENLYNSLKGKIRAQGFDVSLLEKVPQTMRH